MDTFVLEIVLILTILVIFMIYYWQQIQSGNKEVSTRRVVSNHMNSDHHIDEQFIPIIPSDRILGPIKNFHQQFSKNDTKRLGWRNLYTSQKNTVNYIAPYDNFGGMPTRYMLDNPASTRTNADGNAFIYGADVPILE